MRCPFVQAVSAGDLARARDLSFADGGPCEDAVFEQLVEWARCADVDAAPPGAHADAS